MKPPKPKKCRECKAEFMPHNSTAVVCGYACAIVQLKKKAIAKAVKEKRDWYSENATPEIKKKELQPLINKIARLVDYGQPCIATGSFEGKQNGGHYISVGSNATIRFNLHNIHVQSEHSNSFKSGDTIRYQDGIVKVYGQDYLDYMNGLKGTPVLKLTKEQINEAIVVCKAIIKELESDLIVRTPRERIELRQKLNERIGFYK